MSLRLVLSMNRTKLFISYSSRDAEWHDRVMLHLSPLERRSMVHIWSDTRIGPGVPWKDAIEVALSESNASVLLITPAFLASAFIWNEEMPRILAHHKEFQMRVFPLMVKPCAWQLEPDLRDLEIRPKNGRALSLASDAEVDTDLTNFVTELATIIGQLNESVVQPAHFRKQVIAGAWSGTYGPTRRQLQLTIEDLQSQRFKGRIRYSERLSTVVTGRLINALEPSEEASWRRLPIPAAKGQKIVFREQATDANRKSSLDFDGEYRAVVAGKRMIAVWISDHDGQPKGEFELRRD
jgi:hypothetical protein